MLGLGVLLLIAAVVGVPALAVAAFARSRRNERELGNVQRLLMGLSGQILALRSDHQALRAELRLAEDLAQSAKTKAPETDAAITPTEAVAERKPADAPVPAQEARPAEETLGGPTEPPVFARATPRPAEIDAQSLEQTLASQWLVWLGAVAIALSGTFLVKYAIDQGVLGPAVRVTLGFLLGVALAIAGEWLRQRPLQKAIAVIGPNYVPSALTASGLFTAFASIYAAYALYDLLPPLVAFAGLAAIGLAAVGLSLLQGIFVALLGLLCGFVTVITGLFWPTFSFITRSRVAGSVFFSADSGVKPRSPPLPAVSGSSE
jgi:uncharacterized membrane protein